MKNIARNYENYNYEQDYNDNWNRKMNSYNKKNFKRQ